MPKLKLFFFLISVAIFLFLAAGDLQAASFSFEPITQTVTKGTTFDVKILVDTGGEKTANSDALVSFNKEILEISKITGGDFYPESLQNIGDANFRVGGTVTDPTDSRSGQGILATITFKAKKLGTASVSFICLPGETFESNITKNDPQGTDLIDCNQLVAASYTVTDEGSSSPTATPAPGTASSPTPTPTIPQNTTPTPTSIPTPIPTFTPTATPTLVPPPASGHLTPTLFFLTIGFSILAIGAALL